MEKGLVSVIMPAYNCGRFIAESIECVLAQTYTDWELLIWDDCSTDGTQEVVARYLKDKRIHYSKNIKNDGAAISRNRAIAAANGEWIAFLDSDDLWLPEKLEHQVSFMRKHHYNFTYHEYVEIDEQSRELGVRVSGISHVSRIQMQSCCWPGCLSVMYNANAVGPIRIADVRKNNDTAMWLEIIRKSDCFLLKECLGKYRRRCGSITPSGILPRVLWQYRLFRIAEKMNPASAMFWMCVNVFGSLFKKLCYVRHYTVM